MCDYSLQMIKSRPAKVADKLTVKNFGHGTSGFAASEDADMAVCLLPGTEISFQEEIKVNKIFGLLGIEKKVTGKVGIFRQINKEQPCTHHDAVEMPGGEIVLLTKFVEGTTATVLQLPAAPKNEQEAKDQTRLEVVG